jgi:hypothetical protein
MIIGDNLGVQPRQPVRRATPWPALPSRRSERPLTHRPLGFGGCEDPLDETGTALDRFGKSIDVADVNAYANYHDAARASRSEPAAVVVARRVTRRLRSLLLRSAARDSRRSLRDHDVLVRNRTLAA